MLKSVNFTKNPEKLAGMYAIQTLCTINNNIDNFFKKLRFYVKYYYIYYSF